LRIINEETMKEGVTHLTRIDPHLREVVSKYGPPPIWGRAPGFPSLLKIILEQQVSLASAQSAYDKLLDTVQKLTPESFLTLSDEELKKIGFSRQKTKYCRNLAESIQEKHIDLDSLNTMPDEQVAETLTSLNGIGPWTAGIYLLMVLRRPDVWPRGDLALLKALKEVKGLDDVPDNETAYEIALAWSPWRAVAARILWHHYLSTR
jgi:DNA-3-methyladenine glycosylase II